MLKRLFTEVWQVVNGGSGSRWSVLSVFISSSDPTGQVVDHDTRPRHICSPPPPFFFFSFSFHPAIGLFNKCVLMFLKVGLCFCGHNL